ncbi:MAG: FecR family protein [Candidatus Solibacter sp.]
MIRRTTFTRATHTLLTAIALVVSFHLVALNPLRAQCNVDAKTIGTGAVLLVQNGDVTQVGDRAGYRMTIAGCGIVRQQQVIRTGPDGYAKFQVSDGSTFEVFPNTELTFRKTFGIGDLLNVWMGKVKVYIQHFPGIPNPNNVTTPTALISVRGTIFDVDVQDAEGTTYVAVDEGLVDVRHLVMASGIVSLHPGESIQVIRNVPLVPLARDKGFVYRKILQGVQDAARVLASRPGSTGTGTGSTGPIGSTGGVHQGDEGKNTGTTSGSGAGSGAPTGAPPAPPAPPPPGGGE